MKDLAAVPINMALTLWDALPVYLGLALAFAVLMRVWLSPRTFAWFWARRNVIDITGLFYLLLFYEALALPYVVSLLVATLVVARPLIILQRLSIPAWLRVPLAGDSSTVSVPTSPLGTLRATLSSMIGDLFVAGLAAAFINVYGPRLPENALWLLAPVFGAAIVGPRPGAAAIPALAAASASGSTWTGALWIALAFGIAVLQTLRTAPSEELKPSSSVPQSADD